MSSHTKVIIALMAICAAIIVRIYSSIETRPMETQPIMLRSQTLSSAPMFTSAPELPAVSQFRDPARRNVRYRITLLDKGVTDLDERCFVNNHGDVASQEAVYRQGHATDLPINLKGTRYNNWTVSAFNDNGEVIGTLEGDVSGAYTLYFHQAVIWRRGRMSEIAGAESQAVDINNRGDVLITNVDQTNVSTYYSATLLTEGKLKRVGEGSAHSLNDHGAYVVDRITQRGVDYYFNGNEKGNVIGNRKAAYFLVDGGVKYAIEASPGVDFNGTITAMNNSNIVVGTVDGSSDPAYPLVPVEIAFTRSHGRMTLLGSLGGFGSRAEGINDRGVLVGAADAGRKLGKDGERPTHAFIYEHGRLHDLNHFISQRSGWVLSCAWDINNLGQIVCVGNKGLCLLNPIRS